MAVSSVQSKNGECIIQDPSSNVTKVVTNLFLFYVGHLSK